DLCKFQRMIAEGICRPSNSPWASPLHIVMKKDGTIRPCGDYRQLNNKTIPDRYGVPNISDFNNQLFGATIFSTLDIKRAYHHIPGY
ncbi:reverse transcriptase family protein, partial [Klebsiella pneumoniae]|uniref:reverse transcriptase family protein n=1 Tax=Klebsiella pneumoniae TaxID=573 RepID=UPI004055623B